MTWHAIPFVVNYVYKLLLLVVVVGITNGSYTAIVLTPLFRVMHEYVLNVHKFELKLPHCTVICANRQLNLQTFE